MLVLYASTVALLAYGVHLRRFFALDHLTCSTAGDPLALRVGMKAYLLLSVLPFSTLRRSKTRKLEPVYSPLSSNFSHLILTLYGL